MHTSKIRRMPQWKDLYELEEDERIKAIVENAMAGRTGAVVVEDQKKAERYITKIRAASAYVHIGPVLKGPTPSTVTFVVGPATVKH